MPDMYMYIVESKEGVFVHRHTISVVARSLISPPDVSDMLYLLSMEQGWGSGTVMASLLSLSSIKTDSS